MDKKGPSHGQRREHTTSLDFSNPAVALKPGAGHSGLLTYNWVREQHLFADLLRPGDAGTGVGVIWILSRLFPRLGAAFPRARLRVCLDGGFGSAWIFAFG